MLFALIGGIHELLAKAVIHHLLGLPLELLVALRTCIHGLLRHIQTALAANLEPAVLALRGKGRPYTPEQRICMCQKDPIFKIQQTPL